MTETGDSHVHDVGQTGVCACGWRMVIPPIHCSIEVGIKEQMLVETPFRAGDTVRHSCGETWVLACDQDGNDVIAAGWPMTSARASDCVLVARATDDERLDMLRQAAKTEGFRGTTAARQLRATAPASGDHAALVARLRDMAECVEFDARMILNRPKPSNCDAETVEHLRSQAASLRQAADAISGAPSTGTRRD